MFHLAQSCPHCGARRGETAPAVDEAPPAKAERAPLRLSPEEARSLLAAQAPAAPRGGSFRELAADLVLPRTGAVELLLSVLAGPVTIVTTLTLAWATLKAMRRKTEPDFAGAQLLAVPATSALLALLLWRDGTTLAAWLALATSFSAWLVRAVLRAMHTRDPLA